MCIGIFTHTKCFWWFLPCYTNKWALQTIPVTHLLWYWPSESKEIQQKTEWTPQWTTKEQPLYPSLGKFSWRRDSLVLSISCSRVVRSSLIRPLSVAFTFLIPLDSWPRHSLWKEFPHVNYALCKTERYYSSHICCLLIFLGYSHTVRNTVKVWWRSFPNSRAS